MENKLVVLMALVIILAVSMISFTYIIFMQDAKDEQNPSVIQPFIEGQHNPIIIQSDFSNTINNKYLTFTPGDKYMYESRVEEGIERIEIYVTSDQKTVMGIPVRVVWDRVWLNNDLIEETYDWYAQDKVGNVWYMGEDSVEIISGEIVNHAGSFEAGIDGAKPGIVMLANPIVGQRYYQEFYMEEAEDQGEIVSLKETVSVPFGTFTDCLKTLDISPLDGGVEYKYYCSEVKGVVLEVSVENSEKAELISFESNAQPTPKEKLTAMKSSEITEEEAKIIALKKVPGKVTDIAIEKKFNRKTYVVEVDADNGPETDVVIDFETGEVLDIAK